MKTLQNSKTVRRARRFTFAALAISLLLGLTGSAKAEEVTNNTPSTPDASSPRDDGRGFCGTESPAPTPDPPSTERERAIPVPVFVPPPAPPPVFTPAPSPAS